MRDSRRRSSLKRASLNPPLRFPLFGKRRRASSTETKQVKGMLPLRLFRRRPSVACQRRRIHPASSPNLECAGVCPRWPPLRVNAGGPSVACIRRRIFRCVSAQEFVFPPLRVNAGGVSWRIISDYTIVALSAGDSSTVRGRYSVACKRRSILLANDQYYVTR